MVTKVSIAKELNKKHKFLDHKTSKQIVDDVFDTISESLLKSSKISITGFATFYIDIKQPKKYYNVYENVVKTSAHTWGLVFKISQTLNAKIKQKPIYIPKNN